jgi:hypothetical protein
MSLADQVKSAQRTVDEWPEWMRAAAESLCDARDVGELITMEGRYAWSEEQVIERITL